MSPLTPIACALLALAQAPAPEAAPAEAAPSPEAAPPAEAAPAEAAPAEAAPPAERAAPPDEAASPADLPDAEPGGTALATTGPCEGRPVREVRLAGCAEDTCGDARQRGRFVTLTDLRPGRVLDAAAVTTALSRLGATGFFASVTLACEGEGGPVDVTLDVVPHTFVRRVEVEGNQVFRESEIRKRLFIRSGTVLDVVPGQEMSDETVLRQVESIARLYRREGIETVTITLRATEVAPRTVDVTVLIDEGERERVRSLVLRHEQLVPAPPGTPGCPTITRRRFSRLVGVDVGDVVTSRTLSDIRKRVETFFQSIGYPRPDVEVVALGTPLRLEVTVRTERCWLLRVWQRETGSLGASREEPAFRFRDPIGTAAGRADVAPYDRVPLETWRERLPFGESGVFDRDEAERGVETLLRALQDQGYLFADVVMEHRRATRRAEDGDALGPVAGTIDYRITLDFERRLQGILLRGRRSFPESDLLEVMETNVYDAFDEGGFVQVDKVLFDLTQLKRYYESRGFYAFRYLVTGAPDDPAPVRTRREQGEWVIWEYRFRDRGFRIRKRKEELVVYLEIPFEEGPRTRVRALALAGNTRMSDREARKLLGMRAGGPYGTAYLDEGLTSLRRWYELRGFHRARVVATCEADDPAPVDGLCDPSRVRANAVDLVVRVDEGPRSVVGEVFWRGAFRTDAHILVRDLPATGEPYSQMRVADAARRLRNLGVFNAVRIDRIGLEEDPPRDRVALVVVVEEGQSRFIDLTAGFRTIDRDIDRGKRAPPLLGSIIGQATASADRTSGHLARAFALSLPDVLLTLSAEYTDRHFRGRGHRLSIPLAYGFSTKQALRLLSFTPTLVVPRLLDSDNQLEFKLLAEEDRVNEQLDRTEFGTSVRVTRPIGDHMSLAVGVESGFIRFVDPEETAIVTSTDLVDDAFRPQVRPGIRWRFDNQDNPINPTRGVAFTADLRYILAIDRETVEEQRITKLNNFLKWEATAEMALSWRVGPILAAYARYGGSTGGSGELLPPNERFTLGGSNGLRGFADHAVGRYTADGALSPEITDLRQQGGGNVVLNGSVELRVPVLRSLGLWTATFVDSGGLARTHEELSAGSFRASAGVGLRWLIGDQIPVRLDWAGVFGKRRCKRWARPPTEADPADPASAAFAGECGAYETGYRLHFDLLYPF